jgi:hypothetical protein
MLDPSQVAAQGNQIKQQQVQNQANKDAMQNEIDKAELAQNAATAAGEAQGVAQKTQADNQTKLTIAQGSDSTKLQTTSADNNTAMEIAAAEIEAGKKTDIKDGQGVGGKPRQGE